MVVLRILSWRGCLLAAWTATSAAALAAIGSVISGSMHSLVVKAPDSFCS